jgi:hypothetical protein
VANFDPDSSAAWPLSTAALGGPEVDAGGAGEGGMAPERRKAPRRRAGQGRANSQGLGQKAHRGA